MTSRNKDLEIVYNLEWKNKPANGNVKSNMVGILDIPATTLDWETLKSYLLKNSGAGDDNVKVSYIDSEGHEKAINSQLDFEIALSTFRHKARMNKIITLKLDCVNSKKSTSSFKSIAKGLSEVKMKPKLKKTEEPPEWFLIYMKKFKEELVEEISAICSSKAHQMNMYHARKLKADSYKRTRKTPLLMDVINDKQLSNSAKMERKLESKLEKLEHKTLKIKAKKLALRGSSDSDVGRSSSKNDTATYLSPNTNNDVSMNASVIKKKSTAHKIGGEQYYQTWEICNSGTLPWTSDTELRYAWGSQALKPVNKEISCPPLKPGEKGTITVFLEIPKTPGTYECYWHFYHKGRRFGHWLGCDIIVDEPPVKNTPYIPSPTYDVLNIQDVYELVLPTTWTTQKKSEENGGNHQNEIVNSFIDDDSQKFATCFPISMMKNSENFAEKKEEKSNDIIDTKVNLLPQETKTDTFTFSDSDNQSIVSISDSNSSVNSVTSEDFVMLKMSNSPKLEKDTSCDFASVAPNLTKMNVSSLENIDNIDNLFTKLSINNMHSSGNLCIDHSTPVKKEIVRVDSFMENEKRVDSLMENEKENSLKDMSNSSSIVQQIPIDLSNKPIPIEAVNETVDNAGYAYVHYKGRKIPIAKKHLSSDFLTTAESVPESEVKDLENLKIDELVEKQEEPVRDAKEDDSRTPTPYVELGGKPQHDSKVNQPDEANPFSSLPSSINDMGRSCGWAPSMTSSMNENRFFVFPQFYPGYEVVPPLGASYIDPNDPNGIPFQPLYRYNAVGEVLVNDWTTGLNYTTCVRHPSTITQYSQYSNSPGNSTLNTSRGCSSIPNSNGYTSPVHSSPSPRDSCSCKVENHGVNSSSDRTKFEQNQNANSSFEDVHSSTHASSASNFTTSENVNYNASNQSKSFTQSRASSKVGVPDLLSGATVVATSAINTARSVLNMFVPPRNDCGRWQNGHWISTNPESKREKNLRLLFEMGFYNRDLNATLLARYNDDINAVIAELLQ